MTILSAVLAFRTRPTTLLIVLTYVAIFISVFVTDKLPNVPKTHELDLNEAYKDLHHVSGIFASLLSSHLVYRLLHVRIHIILMPMTK